MNKKRKGELREATESLVVSLEVEIEEGNEYVKALRSELALLRKKLEQEDQ